jgi:hypothetical protein
MPFTAPLLSVAANQFDCLVEMTTGYSTSSGSSSQFVRYNIGAFNLLSDPKNIVNQIRNTSNQDSIQFNSAGGSTIKMTVVSDFTYTSSPSNTNDQAGFDEVNITHDGTYIPFGNLPQYKTYTGGSAQTIKDQTLGMSASSPGITFSIYKAGAGGSFTASGRLLIGFNKT